MVSDEKGRGRATIGLSLGLALTQSLLRNHPEEVQSVGRLTATRQRRKAQSDHVEIVHTLKQVVCVKG